MRFAPHLNASLPVAFGLHSQGFRASATAGHDFPDIHSGLQGDPGANGDPPYKTHHTHPPSSEF